jgi:hypothetical protein
MRLDRAVLRLPVEVQRDWAELLGPTEPALPFNPAAVVDLPAPARRWLTHAIEPGTPLRQRVELRQHGEIRVGAWRRFEALQALAPLDGYIWAVTAHLFGLPIHGYDRFTHGTGDMHHRLLGRIPIVSSSGLDHTMSAAGRLAVESIWVPAVGLSSAVRWVAVDDTDVILRVPYEGRSHDVTLKVIPSGALEKVTMQRWASVDKGPFQYHPFGAEFHDEGTFGGYTVPTRTTAGYGYGTNRWPASAFIRQAIDQVVYH